jgi:hypothetical protein
MKIFVAHSSGYDFKNELYLPLRSSDLNKKHDIYLPHENGYVVITKNIISNSDLMLAEVSYPSTGQGIELGWADAFKIPVICLYKEGSKISSSLEKITKNFIVYKDAKEMIDKLTKDIQNLWKTSKQ